MDVYNVRWGGSTLYSYVGMQYFVFYFEAH